MNTESINLPIDIPVLCIEASSFPDGVMEAHKKLQELVPDLDDRKHFGLSRPEHGKIIYKAAAEEDEDGEAEKLNCELLTIKKGQYVSITISNFMKNTSEIGNVFQELISRSDIDPEGYCVEWYYNEKDVKCMVRLVDSHQ